MGELDAARVVADARERGVPGVAWAVLQRGAEIVQADGVTSLENPLPVTPETLFQVGSITKTVTANVVLQLVERGVLALDAPAHEYAEFEVADPEAARRVTIRHLLTHRAGWDGDWTAATGYGDDALALAVARMGELRQVVPPGTIPSYNNPAFLLLGRIVEVVTGRRYEDVAQDLVLTPARMATATFSPLVAMTRRFAAGHAVKATGTEVVRPWGAPRSGVAVGGLIASARDMLAYARWLLGPGRDRAERMWRPEAEVGGGIDAYGMPWSLRLAGGVRLASHGGDIRGQASAFVLAPDHDLAVIVLSNADRGHTVNAAVVKYVLNAMLGVVDDPPPLVDMPADADELVGRYEATLSDIEIARDGTSLVLRQQTKPLMPGSLTAFEPPPPTHIAFVASDKVIALEGRLRGARGEIFRDETGAVRYLRFSGRLHAKAR